jgi:Tfp pilus assembly protein FimT
MPNVPRPPGRSGGFTFVELVVVIFFMLVLALLGYPAIQRMVVRNQIEGAARDTAIMIRSARIEALKRSRPAHVSADAVGHEIVAFVDVDEDGALGGAEPIVGRTQLHRNVSFSAPGSQPVFEGLTGNQVVFNEDGSAAETGAIRFGDTRGNFLEVRVAPRATGKVVVRKYHESWPDNAEGTKWFAPGDGNGAWVWNT